MVAMAIHAAGESAAPFGAMLPSDTHAVALAATDEKELLKLEEKLKKDKIPHFSIREPDEPYGGALMSIGFPPAPRATYKKYLSRFPLLRS
jgi:hypothetical protein